jgi:hypothetical protein
MEKATIYLDMDENTAYSVEKNRTNFEDSLQFEYHIDSTVTYGVIRLEGQSRSRDIVPIIVAAASVLGTISYAVSSIISAINNKKVIAVIECMQELRDAQNNIVFDFEGKPIFKIVKTFEVVDPTKESETLFEIELFKVFKLKITSK